MFLDIWFPLPAQFPKPYEWINYIIRDPEGALRYLISHFNFGKVSWSIWEFPQYKFDQVYYSTYINTFRYTSLQCYIKVQVYNLWVHNAPVQKWLEIQIWYIRIRHLTIYPPTFLNVSYSWSYGLAPCYEHSFKKWHLFHHHPIHQNFEDGMVILNTQYYFFTLPNTLDDHMDVHMVQQETCLYDLQDLDPKELAEWKRIKKNQARWRKMRRMRKEVEKLVELKRELRLMHKQSWTESGEQGMIWWNREYWDNAMGLRRLQKLENGLTVKKEELLTPLLHVKIESPPTPCLHYPPSSKSSSCFHSTDPNNFVWSNSPSP